MAFQGPGLFDSPPALRAALAPRLADLAHRNVFFGTSSWKYEGWLGQVYTPERYQRAGKFSRALFEKQCLCEYAETFPAVCADFSFYQFPSPHSLGELFATAPPPLLVAFKAPETVTVKTWPRHARYGRRAGLENEHFLNAALLRSAFLEPLTPYASRVAAIIFEFGAFPKREFESAEHFADALDGFLADLPSGFRYAVEIRNREFLAPPYRECLRTRNAAHVFNSWTRMPPLDMQIRELANFTADFVLARALLRPGLPYQAAVDTFSPYDRIQEPYPEARAALAALARRGMETGQMTFLFVNNRLEGNAPLTIQAIAESL